MNDIAPPPSACTCCAVLPMPASHSAENRLYQTAPIAKYATAASTTAMMVLVFMPFSLVVVVVDSAGRVAATLPRAPDPRNARRSH